MDNTNEITELGLTPKTSLFKNGLIYGLYTSAALILMSLLLFALDIYRITWLSYLQYVILIAGIVMATIHYRDKINGGVISYGKAFSTGLFVGITVGVLMAVYLWLYYSYIHPTGLQEMKELTEQMLYERGLNDEMIDAQMAMSSKMMKMPILNVMAMGGMIFWSVLISLITAAVLKKNDDSFNATFK